MVKKFESFIVLIIKAYRLFISPVIPDSCRYEPTCSVYSIIAFKKYGILKGGVLTIKRVLKCNPFARGGYDPLE